MAYEYLSCEALDYDRCTYGSSRLSFRGPYRVPQAVDVAVLGGTEVFGKFVEHPFTALLEQRLKRPVINLGAMNAGLDAFCADPVLAEVVPHARVAVLQVPGAQSASNAFYTVHSRRNDRVVACLPALRRLFPEHDLSDCTFVRHLMARLHATSPVRFDQVVDEMRRTWVERLTRTLAAIDVPVVLLWASDREPPAKAADAEFLDRSDPLFVTREMLDQVAPMTAALVEVVHPMAGPEDLRAMRFSELELAAAQSVPGPSAHEAVAGALQPVLKKLLGRK